MAKTVQLDAKGHRKFGMRDNLAYAAGDFGCNMSFALKSTLIIFWTQFMGMNSEWYAALFMIVMVWDAIDYNEWKNGSREEGTVYSLHSFFRKLAQGAGPSIVLVIMAALGYVEADKGNQAFAVALNMRYLVAALYLLSAVMMFIGLGIIYNLDKKRLQQMQDELAARHAA